MMLRGLQGQGYTLEAKPFSSGGEGDVYGVVGMTDKVVKVYHADRITSELEQKLNIMAKRPPSSRVLSQVAWPLDVVYDQRNQFCGFVMPRLSITAELSEIYVYPPRTNITFQQKLIIAQNICVVISEVHKAGYVFGDFNPRNIGVNTNTGTVAFLDTDSYHIVIDQNKNMAFRCNVCAPGYAAPELLEKCSQHIFQHPEDSKRAYAATPLDTFTKETDNFALAIHMFRLLMNGYTPFGGIKKTESASVGSPGVGDIAVRRDSYCFKPGNKPQATAIPPLETLPQDIATLFTRAFIYGKKDPKQRPSALEWHRALSEYERNLKQCIKNPAHMYYIHLHSCPWCEADDRYAASIAPPISQKAFQTPISPTTSVNRPVVVSPPSSVTSSSGSYIGATRTNAPASGGSTYTAPVHHASSPPTFIQKYKGWIITAALALLFILLILLIKSCFSSTPKSSVEIINEDSTVTVGETIQIRINSTTSRVTAIYDNDVLSLEWESTQQRSGGYYLIYANVTGLSEGISVLEIYHTEDELVYDSISINVKPGSNGLQTPSDSNINENISQDNEAQNVIDQYDGSSMTTATTLTPNTAITGSLETSSDVMWYVLTLDEPGTVTFNMKYPQQDYSDSYWKLYIYTKDNSSSSIMSCAYSGRSSDFSNSVESNSQLLGLDAGTYYVEMTVGSNYSSTAYILTAVYSATEQSELEPNDSYGIASVLNMNTPFEGSLSSSNDVDWYVFTLDEAGTVSFNMQYSEREYSSPYWKLYVYTDDNSSNPIMGHSYSGKVSGFSDVISLDSQLLGLDAGRYYIEITVGENHSSTPYLLTANFTTTAQCEMEPNGSYGTASTLQPNVAYTGSLSSNTDVDWYVLVLDSSATICFNMLYSEREYSSPYWKLYLYSDSNSSRSLLSCSYHGKQTNSTSDQITLNAGRYYVEITAGSQHSSTPYTLTVQR